jgi:hypothetical protein
MSSTGGSLSSMSDSSDVSAILESLHVLYRPGIVLAHSWLLLQRFTLTGGREERFSIAVLFHPRASIVHDNK